jgi:hypothetical protein
MSDEPELYVGTAPVPDSVMLSWRSAVDLVFAEGDFRARPRSRAERPVRQIQDARHHADPSELLYLISSADAVRARLRIQGYTPARCQAVWSETRDELARRWRRQIERGERRTIDADVSEMEAIGFEEWLERVRERHVEEPSSRRAGRHRPWQAASLLQSISDPIVSLHLLVDALGGPVWLDCASLYEFEADVSQTPHALLRRDAERAGEWSGSRIIVLTEGRSDTRIISAALRALHPELADAYQFLDFDEFRIEGGASPLAPMVKVLSGARMGNRMLALFDNDAAGVEAMRSLSDRALPGAGCADPQRRRAVAREMDRMAAPGRSVSGRRGRQGESGGGLPCGTGRRTEAGNPAPAVRGHGPAASCDLRRLRGPAPVDPVRRRSAGCLKK